MSCGNGGEKSGTFLRARKAVRSRSSDVGERPCNTNWPRRQRSSDSGTSSRDDYGPTIEHDHQAEAECGADDQLCETRPAKLRVAQIVLVDRVNSTASKNSAAKSFVLVRPDGLLRGLRPLVLRFASDRRRALRGSVQLVRRRPSCRTGLFVCRRFEFNTLNSEHC